MPDSASQSSGARPVPSQDSNRKHRNVFYGWWVVLAAAVGMFWGAPSTVFSFSVFLKPLMHDFHAGRGQISLGYTLGAIAGAVSAPTIGWLLDRYGARKVILPVTVMFGFVLLLAKAVSASIWQFYFFYVSLGLLVHGAGPVPYGSVISHWFDRRRGLALGLMMFGIGSGAMVMPSLAQHLITSFGWRNSYAILGSAVFLISIPTIAAFLKEKPQDLALLPDGALPGTSRAPIETSVGGLSAHEVRRSRTFWLMVCIFSGKRKRPGLCTSHGSDAHEPRIVYPDCRFGEFTWAPRCSWVEWQSADGYLPLTTKYVDQHAKLADVEAEGRA